MEVARMSTDDVLDHVFGALHRREGGWIVTANLDILRRHAVDTEARALYDAADLRVADGMPLIWASVVQGDALPERVAGSSLVWDFAKRAAKDDRSLYLLGGDPGAGEGAEKELVRRWPELRIVGRSEPWVKSPPLPEELEPIYAEIERTQPDIVLVGLGSPKQEHVCRALRERFPRIWLMGVGISFSFVAGQVHRAPPLLRTLGLEWVHRLVQEPKKLAHRYLVDDLPFAFVVLGTAAQRRLFRI
jgi:N-acetylglucosaminyldiphosphoundecaprenol N-acetyl-beta-D-mannosaminyltransferase